MQPANLIAKALQAFVVPPTHTAPAAEQEAESDGALDAAETMRRLCVAVLAGQPLQSTLDETLSSLVSSVGIRLAMLVVLDDGAAPRLRAAAGDDPESLQRWQSSPGVLAGLRRCLREQRAVVLPVLDAPDPIEGVGRAVWVVVPAGNEPSIARALMVRLDAPRLLLDPELPSMFEDLGRLLALAFVHARSQLHHTALTHAANAVVLTNERGAIEWVNPAFERMWGWTLPEILGRPMNFLKSGRHDSSFYERMWGLLAGGESFRHEFVNRRRDGSLLQVHQTITPVRDSAQRNTHYIGIQEDLSAVRSAEALARRLESHDATTNLPRRQHFVDELDTLIRAGDRPARPFAVIFLDMDRFKHVNEMFGHGVGDRLLTSTARLVSAAAGDGAVVARLGGDEFAILAPYARDLRQAGALATHIASRLAEPQDVDGYSLRATASMGITMYPADGTSADQLMRNADLAMYRAKQDGPATWKFFSPAMDEHVRRHTNIEQRLRQSLQQGGLTLHYQPQIRLGDDRVVGVEALARWHDPVLGHVSPAEFIPVAEDCGLIGELGGWVLDSALEQAERWAHGRGNAPRVAINVSVGQFAHGDLVDDVARALRARKIDPRQIELELTESALALDDQRAMDVVRGLKALGLQIAIDDFGTGYSSLSRLSQLAVDRLKIDASFVRRMDVDGAHLIEAIVAMAGGLNMSTLAEGVETQAQAQRLRELGCQEVQGYLYGRPVPAERIVWHRTLPGLRAVVGLP